MKTAQERLRAPNWRGLLLAFSIFFAGALTPLFATDDYVPPRIGYVDGSGAYESAGDVDWSEVTVNLPLLSGDRIVTHPDSRIEIQLGYDNFLRLGADTDVSFRRANGSETELDLTLGELILRVNESSHFRVFTPEASINIKKEGLYRISVDDNGGAAVTVRKGEARVSNSLRERKVRAGEQLIVEGPQSSLNQVVRSWGDDGFDTWSDRRDAQYVSARSSQYVSANYAGVYDLDRYGEWDYIPAYGTSIWFPFGVASTWSPYSVGRWRFYPGWGWTWVSFESWGWLPYHYGNWYFHAGRWGWCPGGFSSWSPALVDFYYGGGYVGWAPRGYYGPRGRGNVTIINTTVNNYGWNGGRGRRGLTVVAESDFGSRQRLDQVALRDPGVRVVENLRPTSRTELPIRPSRVAARSDAVAPIRGVSGGRRVNSGTNNSPRVSTPSNALQESTGPVWSTRGGRSASQPSVVTVPDGASGRGRTLSSPSPAVRAPQTNRNEIRGSRSTPAVVAPSSNSDGSRAGRSVSRPATPSRSPIRSVSPPSRGVPSRTVTPPTRGRTPTVTRPPSRTPTRVAPSRSSSPSRTVSPSRTTSRPAVSRPPTRSATPVRVSKPPSNRDRKP